uniref:sn-1-specific diacylglycerol lipase n=1 Tax=Micromonas pusilla TaxID=38833 RepID=A0A7S0D2P4_MICPS|mmetsp:Transcript_3775/g.16004  ORF Transcript_3775/g.16004 Transcript_3775/m.16004 type:complete len:1125 (+) Transcript_3775:159-3533(+)
MGGDGEAPAAPAWWPAGGINRPPSPPAWWPEGGINPPARTAGRDGGPAREDDDGDEILASESHARPPEEKTSSPSARRTSTDADPLGAPVVVRSIGARVSPAGDDRATGRGPPLRRPMAFDPLENLTDAWRFIRGDDFSSLAGMDEPPAGLADAFGEHGGGDALTAAVDDRDGAGAAEGVVSKKRDDDATRRRRGEDAKTASPIFSAAENSPAKTQTQTQTEAARKTAIQKKHGGGLMDVHKAVTNVLRLLAREMKPLGMEGVATFDPLSGLFLWREHRRFAAARKRAVRDLYREDVDDEFGARGRGRDEEEEVAEGEPRSEDDQRRRFGDASTSYASTSNDTKEHLDTHPEKLREKRFVASTLPSLKLGARHAAAAYGSLAALLENNSARDKAHGLVGAVRDAIVAGGDGDAAEKRATEAAARSARVSVADIVAADWVTLPFSPASYVCVDRAGKTVVLAIRGTVSTGDLLTDAVSTSTPFLGGWAHSGMVMSAYQVCKTQLPNAAAALVNNPGFNFLVTGHSMGAGVAAILAMLVHSGDADVLAAAEKAAKEAEAKRQKAGGGGDDFRERAEADGSLSVGLADGAMAAVRAVRCHCFAAPSVCSLDLSLNARKHTVSVVAGKDVIPRLCYAAVRRLLRRLNAAAPSQPVMKAISAALGGRDKDKKTDDGFETSARESEPVPSPSRLFGEEPETETTSTTANTRSLGIPSKPKPKTKDLSQEREKEKEKRCQGEWDDVSGERGLELRDHFASDFLVQPGFVIHLRHLTSDSGPTAEARHPTAFTEIPISTRMMADHVPMVYQSAIEAVVARNEQDAKRAAAEAKAFEEETARYGPGGLNAYRRGLEALERAKKTRDAERRRRRRKRKRDEAAMRRALEEAEAARETLFADSRLTRDAAGLKAGPADALASTSPGERLWANVRRVVGVGQAGELKLGGADGADGVVFKNAESRKPRSGYGLRKNEGDENASETSENSSSETDDASRSDSDSDSDSDVSDPSIGSGSKRNALPQNVDADEDAWSEDEEADLLAAVAEMLGLDVSDPMPEERSRRRAREEPQTSAPAHRRQNSWGLGRLGRLVGKLKRDADAMFTGGEAFESVERADEASAFEVDGYVAQARATRE